MNYSSAQKCACVAFAVSFLAMGTSALSADSSAQKKDPVLIYRDAGVNAEQEAKIRQMAQEYEKAGRVRIERLHRLSKQMKEMSYDAELDETKLLALQNELNEIQGSINSERTKLMLKIRGILTAEQKTKLVDLMREKDGLPALAKPVEKPADKPAESAQKAPDSTQSPANPVSSQNPTPSPTPTP